MQTEAIAALAASGAAVLGVPAALAVGLRQARAARHAAELTARAAHDQVRKQARREAAVEFVLAVERARAVALQLCESDDPIEDLLIHAERRVPVGDIRRAHTVIRIEGPEAIAQKARAVSSAMGDLTVRAIRMNRVRYARSLLHQAVAAGNETIAAAFAQFAELTGPDDLKENEAWEAIAGTGVLNGFQLRTLRAHWRNHPAPGLKGTGFVDTAEAVTKALDAFVLSVRDHLDEATL